MTATLVRIGARRTSRASVSAIVLIVPTHQTYAPRSGGSRASGRNSTPMNGGDRVGTVQYGGLAPT